MNPQKQLLWSLRVYYKLTEESLLDEFLNISPFSLPWPEPKLALCERKKHSRVAGSGFWGLWV